MITTYLWRSPGGAAHNKLPYKKEAPQLPKQGLSQGQGLSVFTSDLRTLGPNAATAAQVEWPLTQISLLELSRHVEYFVAEQLGPAAVGAFVGWWLDGQMGPGAEWPVESAEAE